MGSLKFRFYFKLSKRLKNHVGRKRKIQTGDKFGYWTVLSKADKRRYLCRCQCGTVKAVDYGSLLSGSSKSCGCLCRSRHKKRDEARIDKRVLNQKLGRLTPIKRLPGEVDSAAKLRYLCKCDCGREVVMTYGQLKKTRSCGCLRKETSAALMDGIKEDGYDRIQNARIDGTITYSLEQKVRKNNTSGVKGVSRLKNGKYRAYINLRRRHIHLGSFDTLEEAALARREGEKLYYEPILEKANKK